MNVELTFIGFISETISIGQSELPSASFLKQIFINFLTIYPINKGNDIASKF